MTPERYKQKQRRLAMQEFERRERDRARGLVGFAPEGASGIDSAGRPPAIPATPISATETPVGAERAPTISEEERLALTMRLRRVSMRLQVPLLREGCRVF